MALPASMIPQYKEYLGQDRCGIHVFRGRGLVVLPGVFDPTHNTPLLAEIVEDRVSRRFAAGETSHVFEMGTGSGAAILSIASAQGAVVSACDISPMCVINAQVNAVYWGVDCPIYQSDLFTGVPSGRFDLLFWSNPWISGDPGDLDDVRLRAAFDPGYASLRRFLEEGRARLSGDGRVFLGVDRDVSDYPLVMKVIESAGYRCSVVDEAVSEFEGRTMTYVYLELAALPSA